VVEAKEKQRQVKMTVFLNARFYEQDGVYRADEQYFKFWIRLAERFSQVTLCVPTEMNMNAGQYTVAFDQEKVVICPLPMYKSSLDLYLRFPYLAWRSAGCCINAIKSSQVFVAVIPNALGLWLSMQARRKGVPCVFYVRGNLKDTVKYEYRNHPLGFLPSALSIFLEKTARNEMRKKLSFVVGTELHNKYLSHGIKTIPIITSLVSRDDLIEFMPKKTFEKKISLLTVGRLSPERGIETLLEALAILNATCPVEVVCKIIGDGPHRTYLEKKTRKLSLNNVQFVGYIPYGPELIRLYREADLFVLSSHTEGFPKVILEAMANALPIVSTNVGGIPYVLKSEHDSILIPPRKSEVLASSIKKLVEDIDLYNKIGSNANNTIQNLTFDKQAEIFVRNLHDYVAGVNA